MPAATAAMSCREKRMVGDFCGDGIVDRKNAFAIEVVSGGIRLLCSY